MGSFIIHHDHLMRSFIIHHDYNVMGSFIRLESVREKTDERKSFVYLFAWYRRHKLRQWLHLPRRCRLRCWSVGLESEEWVWGEGIDHDTGQAKTQYLDRSIESEFKQDWKIPLREIELHLWDMVLAYLKQVVPLLDYAGMMQDGLRIACTPLTYIHTPILTWVICQWPECLLALASRLNGTIQRVFHQSPGKVFAMYAVTLTSRP